LAKGSKTPVAEKNLSKFFLLAGGLGQVPFRSNAVQLGGRGHGTECHGRPDHAKPKNAAPFKKNLQDQTIR
jgi:hypothetical protein